MKRFIAYVVLEFLVSTSLCYATTIRDKTTFTGPTTIKGTIQGATPFVMEGATVDGYQTSVAVTDPTADRTVTIPDATGEAAINCIASHDYDDSVVDWSMTVAEAKCSMAVFTNASGAVNAILPAASAGKFRTVYNNSGQAVTLKVTGQTGASVATGKYAIFTDNGIDVIEIYEQP